MSWVILPFGAVCKALGMLVSAFNPSGWQGSGKGQMVPNPDNCDISPFTMLGWSLGSSKIWSRFYGNHLFCRDPARARVNNSWGKSRFEEKKRTTWRNSTSYL